ncbi:hypothetical protein Lal_00026228 [Lupinus albus]|nr:hypothetical protein Lal_00026228 [Lupinus albus]
MNFNHDNKTTEKIKVTNIEFPMTLDYFHFLSNKPLIGNQSNQRLALLLTEAGFAWCRDDLALAWCIGASGFFADRDSIYLYKT